MYKAILLTKLMRCVILKNTNKEIRIVGEQENSSYLGMPINMQ